MSVALLLVRDDGRQTEIPLRRAIHVIGRQTDCQIRVPSSGISRHHCEIAVSDGKVSLRDLGSSNGTFVNRKKITQQDLSPGDLVCIGDLVFVLRVDGQPASIDSEDAYDDGLVRTTGAPAAPVAAPKPAPRPAQKPAAPKDSGNDDSSVADFDFLDEDEDFKKQPKL